MWFLNACKNKYKHIYNAVAEKGGISRTRHVVMLLFHVSRSPYTLRFLFWGFVVWFFYVCNHYLFRSFLLDITTRWYGALFLSWLQHGASLWFRPIDCVITILPCPISFSPFFPHPVCPALLSRNHTLRDCSARVKQEQKKKSSDWHSPARLCRIPILSRPI